MIDINNKDKKVLIDEYKSEIHAIEKETKQILVDFYKEIDSIKLKEIQKKLQYV